MNYQHLSKSQRYEIKAYLNCNKSQKFIAEQLCVSQSCISRELNKLKRGGYSPEKAFHFHYSAISVTTKSIQVNIQTQKINDGLFPRY
jgi:IS30 family transposase